MSTHLHATVRSLIAEELDSLVAIRRDLHAHPELGYDEHRTTGVVQRELADRGVAFRGGLAGGTGVLAHIPGRAERAVALRADMDALPIVEETGLPYASCHSGRMHACGHDGHTTILIGTARVLARLAAENGLPRPVTFVFQPAEEGGAGGERMVLEGCLDGSIIGEPVERIYGLHGWPRIRVGNVGSRPGPMLAAADEFQVRITGLGGHAAQPHFTHDPIVCGSAMVQAIQSIVSRRTDPLDAAVVSVTQFHAGTTHNIIPERAEIGGTVRTLRDETRAATRAHLQAIVERTAAAYGCSAELDYHEGYPVTRNDPEAFATFDRLARETIGAARVEHVEHPTMGGEDFSYYGQKVPACFFALGLLPPGRESMPGLHHPRFDFNDDAITVGVEMMVRLAMEG